MASRQLLDLQEARQKSVLVVLCERRQVGWNLEPIAGRPGGEVVDEENQVGEQEEQMEDLEDGIRLLDRSSNNRSIPSPLQTHSNSKAILKSPPPVPQSSGHVSSRSVNSTDSVHSPLEQTNNANNNSAKPGINTTESKEKIV